MLLLEKLFSIQEIFIPFQIGTDECLKCVFANIYYTKLVCISLIAARNSAGNLKQVANYSANLVIIEL